jgi:ABC-2 type transport system ATP-binding protein
MERENPLKNGSVDVTTQRLEIDSLSKRYGNVVALANMSFDVHAGEIFGFVGSNGAGKTTTMRIALGVLAADAGEVRWDGVPVTLETRRHIGYMPEERGLYPRMKVGDQLIYLARLHGMSAGAARASMEAWTERLGVAARRGDDVQKLSLGNQQRVQLAAALVHDPRILVLDEPFSGLDPVAVDVMSDVLRDKASQGIPVVFSSHQLDLVERICDRVGVVRSGSMVAAGSVDELRAGGNDTLVVVAPGTKAGWADALGGVTVQSFDRGRTELQLEPDADDQAVLAAALATGPVHEFARRRPSLTELFRHIVSSPAADDVATTNEPTAKLEGARA